MSTDSVLWGLMMMGVGMGTVFALLLLLMAVLLLMGRLDREPRLKAQPSSTPEPGPGVAQQASVRIVADGLDEFQVAAITLAVVTHAENRRRLAAPETRAAAPGSQLFASRWLTVGRGRQTRR